MTMSRQTGGTTLVRPGNVHLVLPRETDTTYAWVGRGPRQSARPSSPFNNEHRVVIRCVGDIQGAYFDQLRSLSWVSE